MEEILSVQGLGKAYPGFALEDICFSVAPGQIMGLIGRNGAGKTTTLKALLNFVHPDGGEIRFFGLPFRENELAIKGRIGFVSGGMDAYRKTRLHAITAATRPFYPAWDEGAYARYLQEFSLDERKTPDQLSAGMRVKYALALALSHHAKLLILDEPTSGLDPVSRDQLLDVFLALSRAGVAILFSTHITSDLDACADGITYLQKGRVGYTGDLRAFAAQYAYAQLPEGPIAPALAGKLIGCKPAKRGYTALVSAADAPLPGLSAAPATLEQIMIHLEKELDAR